MGGGGGGVPETAAEKALQQVAAEQWNRWQSVYGGDNGYESKFIRDVTGYDNNASREGADRVVADRQERAIGKSQADIIKNVSPIQNARQTGVTTTPILGKVLSKGSVAARGAVKDQQLNALQGVLSIARGEQGQVMKGFEEDASIAANRAAYGAYLDAQRNSAFANMAGSAIGAGAWYGKKMGEPAPVKTPWVGALGTVPQSPYDTFGNVNYRVPYNPGTAADFGAIKQTW